MDDTQAPGGLTLDECLAWMKRYRSTPWNMLPLAVTVDMQPSPLSVMAALAWHAERLARPSDAEAFEFYDDPANREPAPGPPTRRK